MKISARLAFIFPLLLTLAVFWQVTRFDFVTYDDELYIYQNSHIAQGLTHEAIRWAFCADLCFDSANADYWQPMTMLSRMLDIHIWGLNPHGHHSTNLLIHLTNVLLLYSIFLILSGQNYWLAAWIAAGFGIHPVQADIVPWVTARKDVLNIFFGFCTVLMYLWYTKKISWKRYVGIVVLYAFALMSKPMLCVLPLLLLILDYWPLQRWKNISSDVSQAWQRLVLEKTPLFLLGGAAVAILCFAKSIISQSPFYYREIPFTILKYVRDFIFPVNFSALETISKLRPLWQVFAACVPLAMATYFLIRAGRRHPYLCAGGLWFLAGLLPVIFLQHEMRFLYVSVIGLLVIMAWGFIQICQNWNISKYAQAVLAVLLLSLWSLSSFVHAQSWRNSLDLGAYSAYVRPDSALAHSTLAMALWNIQDPSTVIQALTKPIKLSPGYNIARSNLAALLSQQGKNRAVEFHFKRALELDPRAAKTYNNYGVLLEEEGKYQEAVKHYDQARGLSPELDGVYVNLSRCLWTMNKKSAAVGVYAKALSFYPNNAAANLHFGFMLAQTGRYKEAIHYFAKVVKLNPRNAEAYNYWGNSLIYLGRPSEAISHFEEAIKVSPQYAEPYNNLANVWVNQEKWDDAAAYFQKALELKPKLEAARRNLRKLLEKQKKTTGTN